MRLVAIALISAACVMLVACAGPGHNPNAAARLQVSTGVQNLIESEEGVTLADPRIRCENERRVGSNFQVRTCMLREEYAAASERSRRDAMGHDGQFRVPRDVSDSGDRR